MPTTDDPGYGASLGYTPQRKPSRPDLEELLRALDVGAFSGPGTDLFRRAVAYAISVESDLRTLASAVAAFLPVSRLPDDDPRRVAAERGLETAWMEVRGG